MSETAKGLIQLESKLSFEDTLKRLESEILSRGLTIFARIDFSGDASKVGLKMNPTRLLVFGNPKAGTPLIIASPTIAIDFPLKILVSQDDTGKVCVSHNSIEYLESRHNISKELLKNISGITLIAESVEK